MLSFLSSDKRSRRVAGKLYKKLRGKQNKGYVIAMERRSIARNFGGEFLIGAMYCTL